MDVVLKCDALGGSSTLKVGDSGDDDRYLAAVGHGMLLVKHNQC